VVHLVNFKKLKLISYTVIFYLHAVYLVKFKEFKDISFYLERRPLNKTSQYSPNQIFKYERKISKLLNIKKCLISSICLFYLFKHFGIECQLKIGINKLSTFSSHSWVEAKNYSFLKDPDDSYKIIRNF
jgi:hypothetical protein